MRNQTLTRSLWMAGMLLLAAGAAVAQGREDGSLALADNSGGPTYVPPPTNAGSAHFAWADVLRVDPVYETVAVTRSRRECHDVRVVEHDNGNGTTGAVLGAIVGGVLGNTVGKGDGRQAATVAGAVAGGVIGHGVASRDNPEDGQYRRQCRDVPEVTHERRVSSYDVEYRYQGDVYMSRLAYDPGERLRVRVSVTPVD